MSIFGNSLRDTQPKYTPKEWVFVPYDQLNADIGPLHRLKKCGALFLENSWKGQRRPYHKQKLALILANMRHFALELAQAGIPVKYRHIQTPYHVKLKELTETLGPIHMMEAAEYELRQDLAPLVADGSLIIHAHEGWLTEESDFNVVFEAPPWRMDRFYQAVRKKYQILMENGKPMGGKYSFDSANRKRWPGEPKAPELPRFETNPIKEEVIALIETHFSDHPGTLKPAHLPCTRQDADALWKWAKEKCMPLFGPYEDAMSETESTLFHTRISSVLNLHRLLPRKVLTEAIALDIPLQSKEGFVRQLIGWREFVRHVHRETQGFRQNNSDTNVPGDAGYGRWRGTAWQSPQHKAAPPGGATPNFLNATHPLPSAFWGQKSGLNCLDKVVSDVWQSGYGHHITRLMVLSNIATLLDCSPRELTDWFWVAYTDAYDWVVEPNVLAMGTFATGELMTTKPYVSGANYIHKMSDYCGSCAFDPKKNCPLTSLYWAFLERHNPELKDNLRLGLPMNQLKKRPDTKKAQDAHIFETCHKELQAGNPLSPESLAPTA